MVVFFQPTFHKYFLEQAQGLNPNLAHSCSDVIEFTCLGFCLPHLPSSGKGSVAQLSQEAPVSLQTLFGGRFSRDRNLLFPSSTATLFPLLPFPKRKSLSTFWSLCTTYQFPPLLPFTSQPPKLLSSKTNDSISWEEFI